jgi:lipopolysaccharide transport system ATP-binding protein
VHSSSAGPTTGSRSKSDDGASFEEHVAARKRGQALVLGRLHAGEQGREEERRRKARIAPGAGRPHGESASLRARARLDGATHGRVPLGVCIEEEARPVGRGQRSGHEMGDGDGVFLDERLLLRRECCLDVGVRRATQLHPQAALIDARLHLDRELERRRPELLEPEAILLDEVEREAVAARRAWRDDGDLQLDGVPRLDDIRKRRTNAVPDDRVSERIEPVVCELDSVLASGAPGCGARILQCEARSPADAGTWSIELVRQPANSERPNGHGVLADAFHAGASLGCYMERGEISVDGVSRRFRIHARDTRTLKDLFVQRGRSEATDVWALHDVSLDVDGGEAVGLIGRNGSGKTTLLRIIAGIIKPTTGSVRTEGRIGSLLELGAGFHPDFTGRENVFLNGAIHGLRRTDIRRRFDEIVAFAELEHAIDRPVRTYSSGMSMRLGFAVAAFLDADVLLLDEVFAVGDEAFQRKCFGQIFAFKENGGTIVFVSHDASAVERLCERSILLDAGRVAFDGPTREAVSRYRRALGDDVDPAERGAGLREWGTGEVTIESAAVVGQEGSDRLQFLSGEPFALRVSVAAHDGTPPPRLQFELRDDAGMLLAGEAVELRELGWTPRDEEQAIRFDVGSLPLAEGRFHLRIGLTDESGERLYHQLDDALVFVVYPGGEERGVVRFAGSWALEEKATP